MDGEKYALYLFQNGNRIIQDTNKVCFITYEETLINGIKYVIENILWKNILDDWEKKLIIPIIKSLKIFIISYVQFIIKSNGQL